MADVPTEALAAAAFKDLCATIKAFKENPTSVTEVNGYRAVKVYADITFQPCTDKIIGE